MKVPSICHVAHMDSDLCRRRTSVTDEWSEHQCSMTMRTSSVGLSQQTLWYLTLEKGQYLARQSRHDALSCLAAGGKQGCPGLRFRRCDPTSTTDYRLTGMSTRLQLLEGAVCYLCTIVVEIFLLMIDYFCPIHGLCCAVWLFAMSGEILGTCLQKTRTSGCCIF